MRSVVLIFAPPEWGKYWARYLKAEAESSGKELSVTEMWDKPQNLQLWYGADRDFFLSGVPQYGDDWPSEMVIRRIDVYR
jgi:hypothetical protein